MYRRHTDTKVIKNGRVSNPVSVKNLTAIETSTIVKLLRPYVPVGTKRTTGLIFYYNF
jgi:hypothetical protein